MDFILISIVFILIFMDSDGFRWAPILYICIDVSSDVCIGKDIIIGLFHVSFESIQPPVLSTAGVVLALSVL